MLPIDKVDAILAPHKLQLTDGGTRVKSTEIEFGTVGIEAVYEMMFLHNVPREQALQDVSSLLNVLKKPDPVPKLKKKKVVAGT